MVGLPSSSVLLVWVFLCECSAPCGALKSSVEPLGRQEPRALAASDGAIHNNLNSSAALDATWSLVRHLYPFAPAARPARRSAVLYGEYDAASVEEKLRDVPDFNYDGAVAGVIAQQACSLHFGAGRVREELEDGELKMWRKRYFRTATVRWGDKSVTVLSGKSGSTYKFLGPQFGCVQENHWKEETVVESAWEQYASGREMPGLDPEGKLAKRFERLLEQEPPDEGIMNGMSVEPDTDPIIRTLLEFGDGMIKRYNTTYALALSWRGMKLERYSSTGTITRDTKFQGWSMSKSILALLLTKRFTDKDSDLKPRVLAKVPEMTNEAVQAKGMTIENMMNMRIGCVPDEGAIYSSMSLMWAVANSSNYASTCMKRMGSCVALDKYGYSSMTAILNSRELRYSFPPGIEGTLEYGIYPWKALFAKINATSFMCETDASGIFTMNALCYATAADWVRLGELVLHRGKSPAGEQVIPEFLIHWLSSPLHPKAHDVNPQYTHGWYRMDKMPNARRRDIPILAARGTDGQELVIVPSMDLVVARLGSESVEFWEEVEGDKSQMWNLIDALASLGLGPTPKA